MCHQILATAALAHAKLDMSDTLPTSKMSKVPSVTGLAFVTADGKTSLTEANVISYLLSEHASDREPTLQHVGATPEQRLIVLQWLFWNQARFEPAVKRLAAISNDVQTRGPEQKAAAKELVGLVNYLETELRDENWQGRTSILEAREETGPSLADVALAITLHDAFVVAFDEDTREDYGSCLKLYTKVREIPGLETFFSEPETREGAAVDDSDG